MSNKNYYIEVKSIMLRALADTSGKYLSEKEAREIASIAFDILADNPSLRNDDRDVPQSAYAYREVWLRY